MTITNTTNIASNANQFIGNLNGNAEYFNGSLDEFALYTTALTPAQALRHYQAAANPAVAGWTWQNELFGADFLQTDLAANHVRVFAKGIQAEVWDYPAASSLGLERYRHIVDRFITSNAQAQIRAVNELRLEQRLRYAGQLHAPLNPGIEVWDVMAVTDSSAGLSGQLYRCQALTARFDAEKADYDLTIELTGVP